MFSCLAFYVFKRTLLKGRNKERKYYRVNEDLVNQDLTL